METLFVTGGSSALGQNVLRRLAARVRIIAVMNRRDVGIPNAGMQVIRGGLEECVRQPAALQAAQIVLHMAAVTHTDDASEYLRVNNDLTKQLLSVCNSRQHFVYVSTICAHPDGGAYGRSKWLAEEAIRASGLEYTIIRPAEIYGSQGSEGIDVLIAVARKMHILLDFRSGGSIKYAPISLADAAQFIAEATAQRRCTGQTYTLCGERPCTAVEMARALRRSVRPLFAVPVPVMMLRAGAACHLPVPFKRDQLDRLVVPKVYSDTAARRDYDFRAHPFLDYLAAEQ